MKRFTSLLTIALLMASNAYAAGVIEKYSLNNDNTSVEFYVSYMVLARVSGHFDNFKGSLLIDAQNLENSRADIVIQTASVDTGVESRDIDIRGPDLFNADLYPTMTFHSSKIEMITDDTGLITGDLTLLGITKPVTLNLVKLPGRDKTLTNGYRVTGQIKRSDFGMNAYLRPIGDIVTLLVCYNLEECEDEATSQTHAKKRYNQ